MEIPWRASGPKDSLLWRLDLLAGACAVAILVVGCVLDVFLSLIWAVFSSGATIVVLAAFAYFYLHFRLVMSLLEDRLRGRGSYKFDVFISYRHRQHSKIAQSVHAALEDRGLRVWLDKRGGVPRSSWGLFLPMLRGLRSSRAVVFLVPEEEQTKEDLQRPSIDGWRDQLKWFCVHPIEQAIVWWHQEMYGVRLLKLPDESWQQWERRIALETQVSLFWSVRIDRGDMITSDMERVASSIGARHEVVLDKQEWSTQPTAAPPVEASELRRENVVVRLDHVEKDITEPVERGLKLAAKRGREIPMRRSQASKFVMVLSLAAAGLFFLAVAATVDAAWEAIKAVLVWPFVQIRNLMSWARARLIRDKPPHP